MMTPYTPQTLLDFALKRERVYLELSQLHPPGTFHEGRNTARLEMEQALQCARWMEVKGVSELAHVGPFVSAPFSNEGLRRSKFHGQKVRIRAGALIRSLHPSQGGLITTERARVVRAHDVYTGYVDLSNFRRQRGDGDAQAVLQTVRQPEVVWVGSGGYWCHADLNDAELVDATEAVEAASAVPALVAA